jgi:hypothetical protein
LATLLRIVLLAELSLYVASVAWCRMVITLPWSVSLAAALLVPFSLRTALISASFASAARRSRDERLPTRGWLAALRSEVLAPIAFLSVYGPFDRWLMPEPAVRGDARDPAGTGPPPAPVVVLLVHGYLSNRGVWWRLAPALRERGHVVHTVDLEPPFAPLDRFVGQVRARVDELVGRGGHARVVIVAHSMGGLASRAVLAGPSGASIAGLVTIATPHHGTRLAPLGLGECARDMRVGSPWMRRLAAAERPVHRLRIASVYGVHDNVVVPATLAWLPGARNEPVAGLGHLALVTDTAVIDRVLDRVDAFAAV